ncbi:uncharacterized protein LOC143286744 [Babylonia areolata]|uniref:uncharacterized protein LOC143286744 n=1 Tax=Babylonia areolata TaxID=304850 RepID=UPI003FD3976C
MASHHTREPVILRKKWQLKEVPNSGKDESTVWYVDQVDVKIAGARGEDQYLAIDLKTGKPVTEPVLDLKEATWELSEYQSDTGDEAVCTLCHKASGRLLAVDDITDEPTTVLPSKPIPVNPSSPIQLDRRLLLKTPRKTVRTHLIPVVCKDKSLTYDDSGVVRTVPLPQGEDYTVHEVRENLLSSHSMKLPRHATDIHTTAVHLPTPIPVCTVCATNIPSRELSGTEPVGKDEPDCSKYRC